jgi:hypothetical protein
MITCPNCKRYLEVINIHIIDRISSMEHISEGVCKKCKARLKYRYERFSRHDIEILSLPFKSNIKITAEDLLKVF